MDPAVRHNERELLQQLSAGDRTAFTNIYTQYYPQLFRYLFVVTRSKEAAEEILQDVFLKLWIKRTALAGIMSLPDYLFRMAKNRVFDARRKEEKERQYLKALTSSEGSAKSEVFDAMIGREYHQLVRDGLSQMPERRREIFLMNALEELTAREIAERLQLTLAVVKKQLYESHHFLRKYLADHGVVIFLLFFY